MKTAILILAIVLTALPVAASANCRTYFEGLRSCTVCCYNGSCSVHCM